MSANGRRVRSARRINASASRPLATQSAACPSAEHIGQNPAIGGVVVHDQHRAGPAELRGLSLRRQPS